MDLYSIIEISKLYENYKLHPKERQLLLYLFICKSNFEVSKIKLNLIELDLTKQVDNCSFSTV